MQRTHTLCDDSERIHIKSAVRLVKNGQSRVEHSHLENLVTLLFTTGKTDIDLSLRKLGTHLDERHLLPHKFQEITGFHRIEPLRLSLGIDSCLHKIRDSDTRNFDRILERHEDSGPRTLLRRHCEQILAHEVYATLGNCIKRLSGKHA